MFAVPRRNPVGRPDAELVAWAAGGDRAAFGELVRRHGSAVRALLRRMGADSGLAYDLAQDAFITAFQKIASLDDGAAFLPWTRRIAARLLIRRWRRDRRLDFTADPPEPDSATPPSNHEPGALRLDLEQAMKTLTAAQRLCVSLCYGADMTHAEAAEALNAPLGTVKSHVKRGLDKLRDQLSSANPSGSRTYG